MTADEIINDARNTSTKRAGFFTAIGNHLGIPYLEERETERVLSVPHTGKWNGSYVKGEKCGREWDSGTDYAKENWPDSFNTIDDAMVKIDRPKAMWYHYHSMNLVILCETSKVGIRSTQFSMLGFHGGLWRLVKELSAKMGKAIEIE